MVTILAARTAPCDLEVKQVDKEVVVVRIEGDKDEKQLCWACLRRYASMKLRKNGKPVPN
jgi:hypothetical protein